MIVACLIEQQALLVGQLAGFQGQGPASGPPRRGPELSGAGRGQYSRPSGCLGAGPRWS